MRDENGKMRLRPATLIAMLALFIAIGGTATAASKLINGKTIKKGTVAGKAFKNKTITEAKISTASLAALAGAEGPRGERGEKGANGDKGPIGDQGPAGLPGTTTLFESGTKVAQAPNVTVDQVVMDDLPGSRYIGLAKVTALSQTAGSQVICTLEAQNGGGSDEARWTNPANSTRGTLWMVLPTETETGQLKVECNAGTSSATFNTELTLIPAL